MMQQAFTPSGTHDLRPLSVAEQTKFTEKLSDWFLDANIDVVTIEHPALLNALKILRPDVQLPAWQVLRQMLQVKAESRLVEASDNGGTEEESALFLENRFPRTSHV
jgi:hypothetical protein